MKLREETFTTEDQVLPWLKQDFLKQEISSLTQQFLKVKLSSRGYVVKKEPHNKFFISRKGLHNTQ